MNNIFKGLGIALITPFNEKMEVDYKALGRLIERQIKEGTDFLCILATTAETPCLSGDERKEVRKFIIEKVAGRVPLLLGCGGNHTSKVVNDILTDDFTGIDGLLSVCPYYNKPTQEGLYQHFRAIAAATNLPIVLYNVPGRTGVNMTAETTLRLANDCDNIVAIKEASGKLDQIEKICKEKPEGFGVLSGDDGITADVIRMGGEGVISVLGNALTDEFGRMVHAAMNGETDEAAEQQKSFGEICRLLFVDGNPAGIKALLTLQGRISNYLRLPLVPATAETVEAIASYARK